MEHEPFIDEDVKPIARAARTASAATQVTLWPFDPRPRVNGRGIDPRHFFTHSLSRGNNADF